MSCSMKLILPWIVQGFRWINIFLYGCKVMVMSHAPTMYTNMYVRTATLDPVKKVGFLQPLQGRTHQIKSMLSGPQRLFLQDWLSKTHPQAWEDTEEHFQAMLAE